MPCHVLEHTKSEILDKTFHKCNAIVHFDKRVIIKWAVNTEAFVLVVKCEVIHVEGSILNNWLDSLFNTSMLTNLYLCKKSIESWPVVRQRWMAPEMKKYQLGFGLFANPNI